MSIENKIVSEIYRLRSLDKLPRYIYLGESEYRDLRLLANTISVATCNLKEEFMGIEIISVPTKSHFNIVC